MKDYVFLDSRFIDNKEVKVSCFDTGFLYGFGLFETMRSYDRNIFKLDAHLDRLFKSAKLIGLKLSSKNKLKEGALRLLRLNSIKDAYIRLTIWKGSTKTGVLIFTRRFPPYPYKESLYKKGFKAIITRFRQNEASILSRIKSLNYLMFQLAYQEAKKKGAQEGLILNTKDYLAEGSRTNIFLVKDNRLYTPSLSSGCLAGITREVVIELAKRFCIKVYETKIKPEQLYKTDEVFLTNSLMEIMPVVCVDNCKIGNGKPGEITQLLLEKYRELTIG